MMQTSILISLLSGYVLANNPTIYAGLPFSFTIPRSSSFDGKISSVSLVDTDTGVDIQLQCYAEQDILMRKTAVDASGQSGDYFEVCPGLGVKIPPEISEEKNYVFAVTLDEAQAVKKLLKGVSVKKTQADLNFPFLTIFVRLDQAVVTPGNILTSTSQRIILGPKQGLAIPISYTYGETPKIWLVEKYHSFQRGVQNGKQFKAKCNNEEENAVLYLAPGKVPVIALCANSGLALPDGEFGVLLEYSNDAILRLDFNIMKEGSLESSPSLVDESFLYQEAIRPRYTLAHAFDRVPITIHGFPSLDTPFNQETTVLQIQIATLTEPPSLYMLKCFEWDETVGVIEDEGNGVMKLQICSESGVSVPEFYYTNNAYRLEISLKIGQDTKVLNWDGRIEFLRKPSLVQLGDVQVQQVTIEAPLALQRGGAYGYQWRSLEEKLFKYVGGVTLSFQLRNEVVVEDGSSVLLVMESFDDDNNHVVHLKCRDATDPIIRVSQEFIGRHTIHLCPFSGSKNMNRFLQIAKYYRIYIKGQYSAIETDLFAMKPS